jgi:NAD(P)-dependent dehydrogenase (short-subunit alcohol dehydrogenase family)
MAADSDDRTSGVTGRTAVVTGGSSGIGRAVALALAERGMDVLVVGRRPQPLAATAALHPRIRARAADVSEPADVDGIVEGAVARYGRIDVVVNNAGFTGPGALGQIDPEWARRMWQTNVLGPALLVQAALPHLIDSRGSVINISSTFGSKPAPRLSWYGASKAALEHLTRSWALELAGRGVRVNAVAPGPTESEALDRAGLSRDEIERIKAEERDRIPVGRRGEPEDVAPWVVALADSASWVTGQVIGVDGGYLLA